MVCLHFLTASNCVFCGFDFSNFGGDEFAAIVDNFTPGALQQMTQKFERMEGERNVSISYGYAYTDQLGKTSVKALLDEADRKMYEQKRQTHKGRQE